MDRCDYHIHVLQDRDTMLLLLADVVSSGMLWWRLLEGVIERRRWEFAAGALGLRRLCRAKKDGQRKDAKRG